MTLRQDGVEESSMSASHTLAPEFSALMVIFLSTGPVISTRRSVRPGAGGATRQFGSFRTDSVSRRNRGSWPLPICCAAVTACLQQLQPAARGRPVQLGHERQRVRSQDLALPANRLGSQRNPVDSEVVSEAVHFDALLGEADVRRRVVTCARGRRCRCCGGLRERGPASGSSSLSEVGPGHGDAGRAMPDRGPEARTAVVSVSGTGLLRWIPPGPGWMRSG